MNQPFEFLKKIKKVFSDIYETVLTWQNRKLILGYGIKFIEPNYLFIPRFMPQDVIIDVGCGFDADFSMAMIKQFGVKSYGVDPTKRHFDALKKFEEENRGNFFHLPFAVASENGEIDFFESEDNVSGSLLKGHRNVVFDKVESYLVKVLTLPGLLRQVGIKRAKYLKLDLEGAEYDLIFKARKEFFEPFEQVFIEFHHGTVSRFNRRHTKKAKDKLKNFGFLVFSVDDSSYLFFKP